MSEIENDMLNLGILPVDKAINIIHRYELLGWNIEFDVSECEVTGRKRIDCVEYSRNIEDRYYEK